MKQRNTTFMRAEQTKLTLALVFGLGLLIKTAMLVFEVSTVHADTVAQILLK
jgi:hypothetical protein